MSKQEEFLSSFPYAMSRNSGTVRMAQVAAEVLDNVRETNGDLRIFTNPEGLSSDLLDKLAYDFSIDWWDYDAPVEQKRKAFMKSFAVARKLGTAGAIKDALETAFDSAKIVEDEGRYIFTAEVEVGDGFGTTDKRDYIEKVVNATKNVRSQLLGIYLTTKKNKTVYCGMAIATGETGKFQLGTEN